MDQYETMLNRAYRHWLPGKPEDHPGAWRLSRMNLARALGASQKGRPTLFEGWMRPRPWALIEELFERESPLALAAGAAEAAGLSESEIESLRELASGFAADRGWFAPIHPGFGEIARHGQISLHDERLAAWERRGDTIRMEFTGVHLAPDERVDGLLLIFEGAGAKALWRGRMAILADEGSWRRVGRWPGRVEGSGWFARPRAGLGRKGERHDFASLPYVDCAQFSRPGDSRPEIRMAFGHSKMAEIAVWGDSVEVVAGSDAIRARDEREALRLGTPQAGGGLDGAPIGARRERARPLAL